MPERLDDIADNKSLTAKTKEILLFFDDLIKNSSKSELTVVNKIIELSKQFPFIKKIFSRSIESILLDTKERYENWQELLYYCKFSAEPMSRFLFI